jgi:hypothetical protein
VGQHGLASSIGLGLAMARPDLRVFVLDGDGSLLMNLGSLATIGWRRPANLVVDRWDNECTRRRAGRTGDGARRGSRGARRARWDSRHRDGAHAEALARFSIARGPSAGPW